MSDPGAPSDAPASDRQGEIASRLRALAASPGDAESLRRGLLWVAGEVQACEQATRQATGQVAALTSRLAAIEAREEALTRATAGLDSFRREFVWLSGEVQARGDALARATAQAEDMIGDLSRFRLQAVERITNLEARGAIGDVRGEIDRYSAEVSGSADFGELARAALRSSQLVGTVRELREELMKVATDLTTSHQSAMAHVAGRTAPLEDALLDLRRELDLVSGHLTGGDGLLTEVAERLLPLEDALVATRQEMLAARGEQGSVGDRVNEITRQIELAGEHVNLRFDAVGERLTAVDDRVATLAALTSDIEGMYRELDRVAELTLSRDRSLSELAERTTPLEPALTAMRVEVDRLAGEVLVAHEQAISQVVDRLEGVAARVDPLELLVDQVAEMHHELRRVSDDAAGAQQAALATTTEQLGLAGRLRTLETISADTESMYGDFALLAEAAAGSDLRQAELLERQSAVDATLEGHRTELLLLAERAERLDAVELAVAGVRDGLAAFRDRVEDELTRLLGAEADERIGEITRRLDLLAESVDGVDERVAALAGLTSDVEGMYRELDRVAELALSRDGALAQIADRTTPLEISVANVRQELDRLAGDVLVGQQGALSDVAIRVDGVIDRMVPLERLADQIADLGQELRRVADEAGSAQQAALAATTEQLGLAGRLRMLEGLPADIEGMYRDFERVAEATVGRDDRQGDVIERQAAVDSALDQLRAELARVAGEGRNTELDLRRRLAGLETITGDLDALYRELGRVTALATEHEDRSVGLDATVTAVRDGLTELRERIEDERIYTTEQVTGLWARMRAVEGVPDDVGRVSTEVEKLAQAVSRAVGESNDAIDGVASRVQALESLPSDVESVFREIRVLADAAREREEQIAALRNGVEPLGAALDDVRQEIDRMRAELASSSSTGRSEVEERLKTLEALPETVDSALRHLTRSSEEITANHQASLASASTLLQDFNDRLRTLEALPADMEGLYAALYRVAESVKDLNEDVRN